MEISRLRWLFLAPAALLIVAMLSLMAISAGTASAASTTEQEESEEQGSSSGVASSGGAAAFNSSHVQQMDIQVVAGTGGDEADVDQDASNNAYVKQSASAESGDASGEEGGTAVSGTGIAGNLSILLQLNLQIVAGDIPDEGVTQYASNDANVDQKAEASSGDADGSGDGSSAATGNAEAVNVDVGRQQSLQLYVGEPGTSEPSSQSSSKKLDDKQETKGSSGDSVADEGGEAESGDAQAYSRLSTSQESSQIVD
jgi:hypothetical protein